MEWLKALASSMLNAKFLIFSIPKPKNHIHQKFYMPKKFDTLQFTNFLSVLLSDIVTIFQAYFPTKYVQTLNVGGPTRNST